MKRPAPECGTKSSRQAKSSEHCPAAWERATRCGWKARLPLYGHEISDTINVWEAGLDRFCKMEKPEFIGRATLEKAKADGLTRTLVGLEMVERGIARDGYKVLKRPRRGDWLRHQRIARAISEEEHCAGVRAAGVRVSGVDGEGRNSRAGS